MPWAEDFSRNEGSKHIQDQVCWNLPAISYFSGDRLHFEESTLA